MPRDQHEDGYSSEVFEAEGGRLIYESVLGMAREEMRNRYADLGIDAEEVTQEALLVALRNKEKLEMHGAGYLRVIVRNRIFDLVRKALRKKRHVLSPYEARINLYNVPDVQAASDAAALGTREDLEDAVARLGRAHQMLIRMRFWEDMDYAVIARIYGCDEHNARARLHEAMKKLRELY